MAYAANRYRDPRWTRRKRSLSRADEPALSAFDAHDFRALDSIPQTALLEPGELAVSFGLVQMWTARTDGTENDAVALLHRRFGALLEDCTSVEAKYARAVQSVFPFSIIAASGQGISSRGGVSSVSPILGIHRGVAGTLFTPYDLRESSTEDGRKGGTLGSFSLARGRDRRGDRKQHMVKRYPKTRVRPYAIDPAIARRLWSWSKRWLS